MKHQKKKDPFITWRLKFATVFSAIVLIGVCSMEIIQPPFQDEVWFAALVLAALVGCLLLLSWSFGMFDRGK